MQAPRKVSQPREVRFLTKFGATAQDQAATLNDDHQTIEDAFAKLRKEINDLRAVASTADLEARVKALEDAPPPETTVINNTTNVTQGEPTPDELTQDQKDAIKGTVDLPSNQNRFVTDRDPRLLGGNAFPVGAVIDFAGGNVPGDWLLCNGAVVNQSDYPKLFAAIGSVYGVVDPVTFSLPDCRGRSTMGAGTGVGLTARTTGQKLGVEQHLLTAAQSGLPKHNHPMTLNVIADSLTNGPDGGVKQAPGSPVTGDAGPLDAAQAHPNIHPVIVFNKIIKAK